MGEASKVNSKSRILFPILIGLALSSLFITGLSLDSVGVENNNATQGSSVVMETSLLPETATDIILATPKNLVGEVELEALISYAETDEVNPSGLPLLDAYVNSFYLKNMSDLEQIESETEAHEELSAYLKSFAANTSTVDIPLMIEEIVLLRAELGFLDESLVSV